MSIGRIVGLCFLVLGIMLFVFGMSAADSPLEEFSRTFTGQFTDRTNFLIIGGVVSMVVGAALMLFGGKRATT
jgi:hypothetical protein